MSVKGFSFYYTYFDVAQELETTEEQAMFYWAIAEYMFRDNDVENELEKTVLIAFKCIKANLKTSKSRSSSGKNGMANRYQSSNKHLTNGLQVQVQDKVQVKDKDNKAKEGVENDYYANCLLVENVCVGL